MVPGVYPDNGARRTLTCPLCAHETNTPHAKDLGQVRGNTERFRQNRYSLWRCPDCATLVSTQAVDYEQIYADYPLNERKLDVFARGTLKNLLRRLRRAGMRKDQRILDYGCGNGIFVDYLRQRGYTHVYGYDPFVPEHSRWPADEGPFDVVINNDTLEHCDDIRGMVRACLGLLKDGGTLYLGTADAGPVQLSDLEPHVMRLHQPFHRVILTEASLRRLAESYQVEIVDAYRRSYHDTLRPFANYRFLDELNRAVGHNLDAAMDSGRSTRAFLKSPRLWFFAFFGFFFPSAHEPALVLQKAAS